MRLERIASVIKDEIAKALLKTVHDKRIGFVSITDVIVSPDLSYAKVFYSAFGSESQKKNTHEGLLSATKVIQRNVAKALTTKVTPKLHFVEDLSIDRGSRVLDQLNHLD